VAGTDSRRRLVCGRAGGGKHLGVTDYYIGLGEPKHVDVTGDYAYVVAPATFDYNRQGKSVNQTDAVFSS
jgi:hypothetical protein